ncbi:MAG: glycosyltransferase [Deltaproteobacteria bacterium]|nr:glycosyltransferase [Deltaproteobacteria bacterium]
MDHPYLSVIIPVFNSEAGISHTLESLLKQDYPPDRWEVIVVDNNSFDRTLEAARSFQEKLALLSIEKETIQSSYAAMNKGIKAAQGEILAFIDADMTVGPAWLSRGVADIMDKEADYVGCRVRIYIDQDSTSAWAIYNQRTGFQMKAYMEKGGYSGAGCLFVRKSVFNELGLYDSRFKSAGDLEFGNRVRDAGFKMLYNHHNVMLHPARKNMYELIKKTVRDSRGHIDLRRYYPERYGEVSFLGVCRWLKPPRPVVEHFSGLSALRKFQMVLIKYFIHYVHVTALFQSYFQIKFDRD